MYVPTSCYPVQCVHGVHLYPVCTRLVVFAWILDGHVGMWFIGTVCLYCHWPLFAGIGTTIVWAHRHYHGVGTQALPWCGHTGTQQLCLYFSVHVPVLSRPWLQFLTFYVTETLTFIKL